LRAGDHELPCNPGAGTLVPAIPLLRRGRSAARVVQWGAMEHHYPLHPETLLEHGPRLSALARRLVRDGHAADDLVQETWLRAVERGGASSTWSWLARVVRNLAFQGRRLDAHRAERERGAARREGGGEPEQRFSGHKELVAAIDRLPEPYRETILLRYFEDLPPRRIAARLGVPVKT